MIELKRAVYKGVEMLFESAPTTGGNRLIKFNYPGSDKQSIEIQGKAPRSFTLVVWIPHDNYYTERDNLLRVLEDGQEGVLTHPTFGNIDKVINGLYTLDESLSDLGRGKITIPFEVNDASGIPTQSGNLASETQIESQLLNEQLSSDLSSGFKISSISTGNFSDANAAYNSVINSFVTSSTRQTTETAEAVEFARNLQLFDRNSSSIVADTGTMVSSISSMFTSMDSLYPSRESTFSSVAGLFDYGDDDPTLKQNTYSRIERQKNRDLLRANVRTQALSYSYVTAGEIEYQSTEDLDTVQDTLERQYIDCRDNQKLSNESLEQLDRVRVAGLKSLEAARVNTRSVITINTYRRPLSALVYSYYGNTDLVQTIADLNNIKQNAFVEGELKVLTA